MPDRRWFLCCFREPWPFRGVGLDVEGLGWLGRREDSKLEVDGPVWIAGEWLVGMGRDFPRFKFDGFMIVPVSRGRRNDVVGTGEGAVRIT